VQKLLGYGFNSFATKIDEPDRRPLWLEVGDWWLDNWDREQ
jgi:hypothetical protein